jgi:arsenite methyltransferase
MTDPSGIREQVRARYAAAAQHATAGRHEEAEAPATSCCGPAPVATTDANGDVVFGGELYASEATDGASGAALAASLGCGVPTAVADLHPGETVLDLGSGGGADVLISARRVAPGGRVIGLDMTPEMVDLARRNAIEAGADNVEFIHGYLEDIPLPNASVDVVISNCVINLAADKHVVLREAARVLRPGGRFAISDVVADTGMDEATRADMASWTGCIAGALTREDFIEALTQAGLVDAEITPTHRVHAHASAAIVRARKPVAPS